MNNDLISRSALKKVFNGYYQGIGSHPKFTLGACLQLIDNAPTVPPEYFPPCEDCNKKMEEIRQAYDKMKAVERPQGEWIIIKDERYGDNVKCPFCEKELAGTDLNFCCKCGAKLVGSEKMNGGAE